MEKQFILLLVACLMMFLSNIFAEYGGIFYDDERSKKNGPIMANAFITAVISSTFTLLTLVIELFAVSHYLIVGTITLSAIAVIVTMVCPVLVAEKRNKKKVGRFYWIFSVIFYLSTITSMALYLIFIFTLSSASYFSFQ